MEEREPQRGKPLGQGEEDDALGRTESMVKLLAEMSLIERMKPLNQVQLKLVLPTHPRVARRDETRRDDRDVHAEPWYLDASIDARGVHYVLACRTCVYLLDCPWDLVRLYTPRCTDRGQRGGSGWKRTKEVSLLCSLTKVRSTSDRLDPFSQRGE